MAERNFDTEIADPNAGKIERLFAKFENIGDMIEGYFAKLTVQKGTGYWEDGRKKQDQNVYEFLDETGAVLAVTGTTDIDAKMALVPVGIFTRIEFASLRPSKREGRSPMKVFSIRTCGSDRKSEAQIAADYHALEQAALAAADTGKVPF